VCVCVCALVITFSCSISNYLTLLLYDDVCGRHGARYDYCLTIINEQEPCQPT
jgi:hypothetical protein